MSSRPAAGGDPDGSPGVTALAARYRLNAAASASLACLLGRLVADPQAPTSVREPRAVVQDHLADSLVALELSVLGSARKVADIGSGAGMPGLPLAIARPAASFSLVESAGRKCAFIARVAGACALANVEVVHARAEDWPAGMSRFDVVTARALAPLAVVAEYAAPLLRLGGALVAWRGRRDAAAEQAAAVAARALGLEVGEVRRVRPYAGAEHRHLHLMWKVRDTPARFPRRPGMAAKRPLASGP